MKNNKIMLCMFLIIAVMNCLVPVSDVIAEESTESGVMKESYVIQEGDTLWNISEEYLDNPFLWPDIWKENRYIANPDLIYPGNMLTIPGILPPVMVMPPDMPAADLKESDTGPAVPAEPEEQAETDVWIYDAPSPVEEAVSAPLSPPVPAGPEIASMTPQESPAIESEVVDAGGYIVDNIESLGSITGTAEDKNIFAAGDDVIVRLKAGSEVSVGNTLMIFRKPVSVSHPETGKYIGKLFIPVGLIEMTRVQGRDASGKIVMSYNYSTAGDQIQPYRPAASVTKHIETPPYIDGYVVETHEGRTLNVERNIVFLDRGTTDGVVPGTVFYVLGEDDTDVIGELKVISVQSHTSTALVTKGVEPFGRGSEVVTITKK